MPDQSDVRISPERSDHVRVPIRTLLFNDYLEDRASEPDEDEDTLASQTERSFLFLDYDRIVDMIRPGLRFSESPRQRQTRDVRYGATLRCGDPYHGGDPYQTEFITLKRAARSEEVLPEVLNTPAGRNAADIFESLLQRARNSSTIVDLPASEANQWQMNMEDALGYAAYRRATLRCGDPYHGGDPYQTEFITLKRAARSEELLPEVLNTPAGRNAADIFESLLQRARERFGMNIDLPVSQGYQRHRGDNYAVIGVISAISTTIYSILFGLTGQIYKDASFFSHHRVMVTISMVSMLYAAFTGVFLCLIYYLASADPTKTYHKRMMFLLGTFVFAACFGPGVMFMSMLSHLV